MKFLNIQFQPGKSSSLNKEEVLSILSTIGLPIPIIESDENGKYVNFNIESENLKKTWSDIKKVISSHPNLAQSTIIVCEGSNGWDNYLLLHHYDKTEKLDEL